MGEHYTDNLRHIGEPSNPDERVDVQRVLLPAHAALAWKQGCINAAWHNDLPEGHTSIVRGWEEYIEEQVFVNRRDPVPLYIKTDLAERIAEAVLDHVPDVDEDMRSIEQAINDE